MNKQVVGFLLLVLALFLVRIELVDAGSIGKTVAKSATRSVAKRIVRRVEIILHGRVSASSIECGNC